MGIWDAGFGALDGKLATAIVVYITLIIWAVGSIILGVMADREKISLNDTTRRSHRLRPRHLVDRHMGRDGTSTLAVAPRGHYCGGSDIGHCRVVDESSAIKPDSSATARTIASVCRIGSELLLSVCDHLGA
jgi:hypothetical protein